MGAPPAPAAPPLTPEQTESAGQTEVAASSADPRVDDAVARLTDVNALPVAEQVEVYADIHRRLAAVLSDPDSQA